jgi:cell fate regulator YaaT (PSP1 superfamily)
MKVAEIQFTPWDKVYYFDFAERDLVAGDLVVVKTELGLEAGRVVGFKEIGDDELSQHSEIKKIIRKVTAEDLAKIKEREEQKKEALEYCKKAINKKGLDMKLVDVHFSLDGGRIVFAFVADGRIDFRELVKDLTRHFQKSIRLHQVGIRDEAKMCGDIGPCGRPLCCQKFLNELGSISSEMAEIQQMAHRGSERISGQCGRLMCCLAFEQKHYEELVKNLPPLGSKYKSNKGMGEVVGHHVLRQTFDVKLADEEGTIIEVPVN